MSVLTRYKSAVLADSPIFSYALSEASGTVATDYSGNSNNGTYHRTLTLNQSSSPSADKSVISVLFNGATSGNSSSGYISTPAISANSSITMEAWVNVASATGDEIGFFVFGTGGSTLFFRNGGLGLSNSGQCSGSAAPYGAWSHVAATYSPANGGTGVVYLNGVGVTTTGFGQNVPSGSNSFYLGGFFQANYWFWPGYFAMPAFYNTALSSTRILAHYNAMTAPLKKGSMFF